MNKKRWVLTAVVVTVVITILEAIFHLWFNDGSLHLHPDVGLDLYHVAGFSLSRSCVVRHRNDRHAGRWHNHRDDVQEVMKLTRNSLFHTVRFCSLKNERF
ncbi:MAG: hypothetical protein HYW02_03385 [Deltaproteobacteria bacterium]|nr:hypothetical protein [Deltaproteobacteria bacterium]